MNEKFDFKVSFVNQIPRKTGGYFEEVFKKAEDKKITRLFFANKVMAKKAYNNLRKFGKTIMRGSDVYIDKRK